MPPASYSPRTWRAPRFGTARYRSGRAAVFSLAAAVLIAGLAGCAAPGEPIPRRPLAPRAVRDLTAHQRGDAVRLRFTVPVDSTRGEPLAEPPTVEIYRATTAPGQTLPRRPRPRLVDTIPGELLSNYESAGRLEFPDPLDPAELAHQPGEQLTYTVRTRISSRQLSAPSNAVTLRVYPAPPAVTGLAATLTQQSVNLTWTPLQAATGQPPAVYRVYRAEIEPSAAAAAKANPSQAAASAAFTLADQTSTPSFSDTHFSFGRTYLYIVRAVASFGTSEVESANSNAVVVVAKDTFPPAAPRALEAVLVPASAQSAAYVELTWAFNTEPDLAGYNVFRSEQRDTSGQQLNTELLSAPSFRDMSVLPGHRYFYRVRAVDRAGNQSPFSAAATVEVPAP